MKNKFIFITLTSIIMLFSSCGETPSKDNTTSTTISNTPISTETTTSSYVKTDEKETEETVVLTEFNYNEIPEYDGSPYITINDNIPFFTEEEIVFESFENYAELDELGRCGVASSCLSIDTIPADGEERGSISSVIPSGWKQAEYDCVKSKSLYNRCHLIGYQLSAENANALNLVTGTRYMNVDGMLPFENMVADYIDETQEHIMYRVTPIFVDDELVCRGVLMEGYSCEDAGESIMFNVFCYNVQPGIEIDYQDGTSSFNNIFLDTSSSSVNYSDSFEVENPITITDDKINNDDIPYVLNTNSHKFHTPTCSSIEKMNESNKETFIGERNALIKDGYEPCGICKP